MVYLAEIISLYNSSFQNCQNLCSCPVFGSEFSKKTGSSVTFQLLQIFVQNLIFLWKSHLMKMQTKIYQLLYSFILEYLSGLTFKPQNN